MSQCNLQRYSSSYLHLYLSLDVTTRENLASNAPPSVETVVEPQPSPKPGSNDKPPPVDKGYVF